MEFQEFQNILESIPDILEKGTLACAEQITELFPNLYDDTDIDIIDQAIAAWKNKYPALCPATKDIRGIFQLMSGEEVIVKNSCGVSEEMRNSMLVRNEKLKSYNNGLNDTDMEILFNQSISSRKEFGATIINLRGFGEFCGTKSAFFRYKSMDKNNERSIDNLSIALSLNDDIKKIIGLDLMSLERTYELINIIASWFGINDNIDLNYIKSVCSEYRDASLPENHPLGRIGRAMNILLDDLFCIPLNVDEDKKVLCFDCLDHSCGVNIGRDDIGDISIAPLADIKNP